MKERLQDILEYLKEFWGRWGWSLVILIVAFAVYIVGVEVATSCYSDVNAPVKMTIDEEGYLGIQYVYEDHEEIHVLWETDGGNIKPLTENEDFIGQNTEENLGYFCYTNVLEKAVWSPEDNDGSKYTTANIRALVYEEISHAGKYCLEGYFIELYMTVTLDETGRVVKAETDRYFSNPIREGDDEEWSQIYAIFQGDNGETTYRYRTGSDIDTSVNLYARWQCNEAILSQTDIPAGYIPEFTTVNTTSNLKTLTQINTVTVDTTTLDSGKEYVIEAFLVEEDYYDDAELAEDKKIYKAELEID